MISSADQLRSEPTSRATDSEKPFEMLVTRYHRQVLAYAMALVREPAIAEDLAQDAFVSAWEKFDEYDQKLDFGKWVRGILARKYRNLMRKKREQILEPEIIEAIDAEHNTWDQSNGDLMDILAACMRLLSEPIRWTVDLHYIKNQDCSEISRLSGELEPTIRKRLQLARKALAKCIERKIAAATMLQRGSDQPK